MHLALKCRERLSFCYWQDPEPNLKGSAEIRILVDPRGTSLQETRIWDCFITDIVRIFCKNKRWTPRKSAAFLTGSLARNIQILAGSYCSNLSRIHTGNAIQSWQDPCSPSCYDPGRFPWWILIGSAIILSEEDPEQFQKNPGKDPDWPRFNPGNRNYKDFEQDRDRILLGSCWIRILAGPCRISPGMLRNETRESL